MLLTPGMLRKPFMGLAYEEMDFTSRGYHLGAPPVRERLERVAKALLFGYNMTIEDSALDRALLRLELIERELRGLAFEGVAMALTVLDIFTPWQGARRLRALCERAPAFSHMGLLGAGMALGVFRHPFHKLVARMDPLFGWTIVDGFGFFYGLLRTESTVRRQRKPKACHGFAGRMFDAGVGRSLWFVECGDPGRVVQTLQSFPEERHHDMWSGVGVAVTFAGGLDRAGLEFLVERAGSHRAAMARGCAYASFLRHGAGISAPHVDLAASVIWQRPSMAVSEVFEEVRQQAAAAPADSTPAWGLLLEQLERHHQLVTTWPHTQQIGTR
jgi:enediyne biosynthesis protein E3